MVLNRTFISSARPWHSSARSTAACCSLWCSGMARSFPTTNRSASTPRGFPQHATDRWGCCGTFQDLYLLASLVDVTWAMVKQAGSALRDRELLDVVARCDGETSVQLRWLQTRMKQAAPQALIAAH